MQLPAPLPASVVCLCALMSLGGCFGGSRELARSEQSTADDFLASLPPVAISPTLTVHAPYGDMIARLPRNWVMLDPFELELDNVFAVGCDPNYTMSLVFSELVVDDELRQAYRSRGHTGLAEAGFQRRQRNIQRPATLNGPIEQFSIGRKTFSAYSYSLDSARTITRVAVFIAGTHIYECAITHLTFSGADIPDRQKLVDIHQLVLGTVEW